MGSAPTRGRTAGETQAAAITSSAAFHARNQAAARIACPTKPPLFSSLGYLLDSGSPRSLERCGAGTLARGRPPGRPASRRTRASAAVQGDRPTPAARSPDIAPPGTSSRQAPGDVGIEQVFALPARFCADPSGSVEKAPRPPAIDADPSGSVEKAPRPPAIVRISALPLL